MAGPELTNRGPSRWEPVAQAQRPRPCEIQGEVGGPARLCHGRWPPQCLTLRQIVQGLCGWKIAMKKRKRRGACRQQGVRGCGEGPDGGSEGPAVWSSRPSAWPSRTDKRGRCAATMVKEMCLTGGEGSVI